jgi:hypothetical protein
MDAILLGICILYIYVLPLFVCVAQSINPTFAVLGVGKEEVMYEQNRRLKLAQLVEFDFAMCCARIVRANCGRAREWNAKS